MSTNPYDSPSVDPAEVVSAKRFYTPGEFRDQSTGLVLFGMLQLVLGGICGLMTLMMVAMMVVPGQMGGMPGRSVLPAVAMYGLMAVGFVGLGVGSIRARRWAWTLTVVVSWLWLALGVVSCASAALWLPRVFASVPQKASVPPQAMLIGLLVGGAMIVAIYIGLPGLFLFFYQRASVRATCEARDPRIPWTDRCPRRVLALTLLLGFGAATMLLSIVTNRGIFPLFGVLLHGLPGAAATVLMAAAMGWLTWGVYRLKRAAWWGTLLLFVGGYLSSGLTFSRVNPHEVYTQMGFSADQLEAIRTTGAFEHWSLLTTWGMLVGVLAAVGFLLWVRRCFVEGELGGR